MAPRPSEPAPVTDGSTPPPARLPQGGEARRRGLLPAHLVIAEQLRRQVELRTILPGSALPTERELMRIFSAGRGTVQRALAFLAEEGLITKRRGRHGGAFVTDAIEQHGHLARAVERVREDRERIEEVLTFRRHLEPGLVAAACERRTEDDLAALHAAQSRLMASANDAEFMHFDDGFHRALAVATHNRFLQQASETIREALNDAIWVLPGSHPWLERTIVEHQAILEAVERGSVTAGRRAAAAHARHTEQSVLALLASLEAST